MPLTQQQHDDVLADLSGAIAKIAKLKASFRGAGNPDQAVIQALEDIQSAHDVVEANPPL